MFIQQNIVFVFLMFLILSLKIRAQDSESDEELEKKKGFGYKVAKETYSALTDMFTACAGMNIPSQQFKIDNIKSFINFPQRTTVGVAPKLTSNRKFFANLVSTRAFKDMVDNDADEIWQTLIKKMKYCDSTLLRQELLKDFYDREVDQTKL